jgi:hypothetical protein
VGEHSAKSKKEKLVESIRAFLTEMSSRGEQQRSCDLCGAVMQSLPTTFWLDGTDSAWSIHLPVCLCEVTRTQPIRQAGECSMNTAVAPSPLNRNWRELYKAALFEPDRNKLSERIAHAEWALALRARELFHTDREHSQEQQAVDAAIAALQTLHATTCNEGRRSGVRRVQAA